MDNPLGWWTTLPPILAIICALFTRQVIPSLFLGIWAGSTMLASWNPVKGLADAIQALVDVFKDAGNTRVILFSALVGSLITLTQRSGGVAGFVEWIRSFGVGRTRRSAGLVGMVTGIAVFIESSITCLVVGAVTRPLSDRVRMSREKLAFICDTTSAPVCILIPLNAWGAYILGLLAQEGVARPLGVLATATFLNFYAWLVLLLLAAIIVFQFDFGPMARAERRAREEGKLLRDGAMPMMSEEIADMQPKAGVTPNKWNMILPIATMILAMPLGLYITGRAGVAASGESADFFHIMGAGSGSTAVLWAVLAALTVATLLYLGRRILTLNECIDLTLKGAGGLMPMAIIMMLAFAMGNICKTLGTGPFVAAHGSALVVGAYVPAMLFALSCVIAFATGTSWGTFAIMLPLAVPLAAGTGGSLPLAVAAVLGGGVFGDHCSPISDTTVVSSVASACDHVDHVKTQLPYALAAAAGAIVLYLVAGAVTTG